MRDPRGGNLIDNSEEHCVYAWDTEQLVAQTAQVCGEKQLPKRSPDSFCQALTSNFLLNEGPSRFNAASFHLQNTISACFAFLAFPMLSHLKRLIIQKHVLMSAITGTAAPLAGIIKTLLSLPLFKK